MPARVRRPYGFLLFALLTAACSADLPTPTESRAFVGQVRWSCAPHDAASIELELMTLGDPEVLSLNLWGGPPIEPGRRVDFGPDNPVAVAAACRVPGECESAQWGQVAFDAYQPGQGASGSVTVGFPSGRIVSGSFSAAWSGGAALCG